MVKTPNEFYEELGYNRLSKRKEPKHTKMELAYLVKLLKKEWKILDLACGYGRFTIPLAKRGFNVEGVDITPSLVEKANELSLKEGAKIRFVVGDMRSLPYKDNSFDAIICMWNSFSELFRKKDQIDSLNEIYRTLCTGGVAILEMRNHKTSGVESELKISGIKSSPHYYHTRGSLRELLRICSINDFDIFLDNLGGRKRLLLKIFK